MGIYFHLKTAHDYGVNVNVYLLFLLHMYIVYMNLLVNVESQKYNAIKHK